MSELIGKDLMTIWIVEDEHLPSERAFDVVKRLLPGDEVNVFRDTTILWSGDIEKLPHVKGDVAACKLDNMPDIVVLDLFAEGDFRAGEFYGRLRAEEAGHRPAAFVIVWSVKTGLPSVNEFLTKKPLVDRRLTFTNSKTDDALKVALNRALKSWQEARYL